jgi:hypothetical protein
MQLQLGCRYYYHAGDHHMLTSCLRLGWRPSRRATGHHPTGRCCICSRVQKLLRRADTSKHKPGMGSSVRPGQACGWCDPVLERSGDRWHSSSVRGAVAGDGRPDIVAVHSCEDIAARQPVERRQPVAVGQPPPVRPACSRRAQGTAGLSKSEGLLRRRGWQLTGTAHQ